MKTLLPAFALALLLSFTASAQITVGIVSPLANAAVGTNMSVQVQVTSTYQIASVVADVTGRRDTLVYNSGSGRFIGTISLAGLSQGTYQLNVTATDVFNNQQTATRLFVYDLPPIVTIDSPLNYSVARPLLAVALRWSDLDTCTVRIEWHGNNLDILHNAKHKDTLNLTLNLAAYNGTVRDLYIYVIDKKSQQTINMLNIYVDSSSNLIPFFSSRTAIADFNYNKVLAPGDTSPSYPSLTNVNTGQQTIIPIKMELRYPAFVTPYGALMGGVDSSRYPAVPADIWLYDWNAGTTTLLDKLNSTTSPVLAGNYAIWNNANKLTRRDLSTRTNVVVSTTAGNVDNSVASNGLVAFWDLNYNVSKYDNGTTTVLTDNTGGMWNTYPYIDGNYIVYRKQTPCCNSTYTLRLITPTTDSLLSNMQTVEPTPGDYYQVKNKFVAFTKLGVANETQVFVKDSLNTNVQRTFFGTNSWVERLNEIGDITFKNGNKRYISLRSGQWALVNTGLGKAYYSDSGWFVAMGRELFRVPNTISRDNFVWTGSTNNNWNNPANWTCNCVPSAGADVTIPVGSALVLSNDVTTGAITLQGKVGLAGHALTINGAVTGNGTFTGSATSSMIINGNAGVLNFTQPGRLHALQINTGATAIVPPGTLTVGP